MISIQGKSKHDGVAIAVAAKVDSVNGINGVAPDILEQGIRALRKGLSSVDYPEAVVASDNVVMGVSLRIPGVSTIGIAAQSDMDVPGLEVGVPCVIGLDGLLDALEPNSLMIIDGNKGVVHIDPDPQILIVYQHIEEDRQSRSKVFIASEHIPARTQSGETVFVYAHITNEGQVDQALDEGADGLFVDLRGEEADVPEFYRALLRAAPGKPLVFAMDFSCSALVEAASGYAAPNQVTAAFPPSRFDELASELAARLEADADVRVGLGCVAKESESAACETGVRKIVVDLRKTQTLKQGSREDLAFKMAGWAAERDAESVLLVIGKQLDAIERLVAAGARSVAVPPDKVSSAKYQIRTIGEEEAV